MYVCMYVHMHVCTYVRRTASPKLMREGKVIFHKIPAQLPVRDFEAMCHYSILSMVYNII